MTRALTPKQEAFCLEYLLDLNATQAAIRAGYSKKTAEWQGPQLLGKSHVMKRIQAAKLERSERTKVDADWMLRRLEQDASADLADLYDEMGQIKPMKEWPMAFRTGLVAGVETVQEREGDGFVTVRKVKLADRARFLEMIGKHIDVGAFREKVELTGSGGGPLQITDTERAAKVAAILSMAKARQDGSAPA